MLLLLACARPDVPLAATDLVAPLWAGPAPAAPVDGGLVYVPVYSSVLTRNGTSATDLTVLLSARNTDGAAPIQITGATFHDRAGAPVHAYVAAPITLGPLASAEAVVAQDDTRAGIGGSFLVSWQADRPVTDPVIEAVMLGTGSQQGISFVSPGRVLRDGLP